MGFLKHTPAILLFIIGAVFLNYYLPSRDVVEVVGTEVKRIDVNKGAPFWDRADIGTNEESTRDVRFINTLYPNGKERVYRNEDTGWGFPFYFKFDSSNVTTAAQGYAKKDSQWVAVKHYGWRIPIFSIYPNAISMKTVSGPNVRIIPWFNIVLVLLLLGLWGGAWWKIRSWKANRIDPTLEKVGGSIGEAARDVSQIAGDGSEKARGFWKKLFGSAKPPSS